jgi:pimeloyl-ACP methyl ester carboxylesterase
MIKKIVVTSSALLLLSGLILALVVATGNPERLELDDAAREQAPGEFVELADGLVHYQVAGPEGGQVVVLVHGFSVPYYIWDPTFAALSETGFQTIRFDAYGRGYSDRPDVAYDGALFERQITGLLERLGFDAPVDIIGLSMGGAVTARFAANNPDRVRRVVLIDPTYESWDQPPVPQAIADIVMALSQFPKIAEGQMTDFLHPENYPTWVDRYRVQMQYKGFRNAIASTVYHFGPEDHRASYARLQEFDKRVLLIWGLQDRTVPVAGADVVKSVLDVEYLPVNDSGHLPHIEQADSVNPAIVEFLSR